MVIDGGGLVPPTPLRLAEDMMGGLRYGQDEPPEQPPPCGNAQREERPRLALNAANGLASDGGCRLFFNASTAIVPARMLVSRAQRPHRERDMPIPAGPAPHFIVVQADFSLGLLKAALDGPAAARLPLRPPAGS